MRQFHKPFLFLSLPLLLLATPGLAAIDSLIDPATMDEALANHTDREDAQRAQVQRVLERDDVRQVAAGLGLDLADAGAALATLSGAELAALAQHASDVEVRDDAGGRRVVISITTLLLIIIIIIILS